MDGDLVSISTSVLCIIFFAGILWMIKCIFWGVH